MENPKESSMNRSSCSKEQASSEEESGWTMYFDDFMESQKRGASSYSSSLDGSSMVSDAASCAVQKASGGLEELQSCKKLTFKKRKARGVLDDDPLEDTASSPVSSPKCDLNLYDVNPEKNIVRTGISQEKNLAGQDARVLTREAMDGLGFSVMANDCTDLKKRGLCLVHFSMLADYL